MGSTKANAVGSIKFFGTGAGWPSADRNHSSHLYRLGKSGAIIDCGESISSAFLRSGESYDAFDRIFLSHTHGDHVGGFFMFMQGLWLKKRKRKLHIHLPEDAIEPVQRMLEACYVFPELFKCEIEWRGLRESEPVRVGEGSITAWATTHLDALQKTFGKKYRQSFQAYSFLVEVSGRRVGHSADIGAVEDLDPLLREPLDLLVCELAHCKPRALFAYLAKRAVREIVFTHVPDPYRNPETEALAKRMIPGARIGFARDGQEISF